MKRFKDVVRPAVAEHTELVFDSLVCDICGANSGGAFWPIDGHTGAETQVGYDIVDDPGWPDDAYHTARSWDICPACFTGKLMPWLEDQGVQIKTEEDAE